MDLLTTEKISKQITAQLGRAATYSILIALLAGCAARQGMTQSSEPSGATRLAQAGSNPAGPAYLSLDQIQPRPVLAKLSDTRETESPSTEALAIYAQARASELNG